MPGMFTTITLVLRRDINKLGFEEILYLSNVEVCGDPSTTGTENGYYSFFHV
jgi:hypothetical protein